MTDPVRNVPDSQPKQQGESASLVDLLEELAREMAALPDFDTRTPDEIIGYDENGLWS